MIEIIRIFQDEDDQEEIQSLIDFLINLALSQKPQS